MLTAVKEAAERVGGLPELARWLDLEPSEISAWPRVPVDCVNGLVDLTGMLREEFRPDLFASNDVESYESDFFAWLLRQITLLRSRRFEEVDLANVIEEIEGLARREQRGVTSNLEIVLMHLLKYAYQPSKRKKGWLNSIREHRRRLNRRLKESRSLDRVVPELLHSEYVDARKEAAYETGLPIGTFPETCPYTVEQVLDIDWLPEAVEEA